MNIKIFIILFIVIFLTFFTFFISKKYITNRYLLLNEKIEKYKKLDKITSNIACCFCVRNCEKFLIQIFDNLNLLNNLCINKLNVVFVYDNCSDNSAELLKEYKNKNKYNIIIINNINNNSPYRTVRIANSRNKCLDVVYNTFKNIDFHFMIDADDINCSIWNFNIILKYLKKNNWDALTFNRKDYYDIWALLYDDFKHHCWGYKYPNKKSTDNITNYMKKNIKNKLNKLKKDELFICLSAFNGFGIYRTKIFENIFYDGLYKNIKKLISDQDRILTLKFLNQIYPKLEINEKFIEHCEHIYFHLDAIQKNNARIRISKEIL